MPSAPGTTQLKVGQPDSHNGRQGATCRPPRRRTPAAVSVPAEEERARNWEERKQQSNWAQSRPTHGSETRPNKTHNNTQGNHGLQALHQLPNAAHAERAGSKHAPPPSTRCPRTPQGRGLRPVRREVPATGVATRPFTSLPRTGQSTSYTDGEILGNAMHAVRTQCEVLDVGKYSNPSFGPFSQVFGSVPRFF